LCVQSLAVAAEAVEIPNLSRDRFKGERVFWPHELRETNDDFRPLLICLLETAQLITVAVSRSETVIAL
jgi:hypothetical protein